VTKPATILRAAGGVIRREGDAGPEVLLVHRPRYNDWSLPKGKREPGETDEQCAVREVAEETGFVCHLDAELLPMRYTDRKGRDKVVRWWGMTPVDERAFEPNDEVDDRRWVLAADAAVLATYDDDVELIEAATRT
jgi:8-oxo-dGTP diphosphatase